MTANISPETKVGVVANWNQDCMMRDTPTRAVVNGQTIFDVKQWLVENNYSIASNGTVYRNDQRGFLPTILEKWFDERVIYKDKRDTFEVGSEEYKFYDAMQLTQKVLLTIQKSIVSKLSKNILLNLVYGLQRNAMHSGLFSKKGNLRIN
jgi:DNA polymerase elongation subunit (family B)